MKVKFCRISTVYVRLLSKYVLHFNGKYRVWRILLRAAYSSSRRLEKSSRCAENHFKFRLCAIPSFPCCFRGRSFSQEKMLPATFERDKSQYRVSTKRDYKGKMTIFLWSRYLPKGLKLRRLGILLKPVKCRVRKSLSLLHSCINPQYLFPALSNFHALYMLLLVAFFRTQEISSLSLLPLHWYSGLDFTSSSPHVE